MARFEREPSEFVEKLVSLNRVSKTVKGGRIFKDVYKRQRHRHQQGPRLPGRY